MSTERLLEIKNQIDNAKSKQSEVKGQIKSTNDQMEQRFKVKTLSAAEKELDKIGKELDEKESELKEGQEKLEGAYDWD